jgi:hypothetical protein
MSTARRRLDGLTSSLRDLPQGPVLQLLVGDDLLELAVLPLEILEPAGVVGLHAAELVAPPRPSEDGDVSNAPEWRSEDVP